MHLVLVAVAAAEGPVHLQPSAQSGHLLLQQFHCCSPKTISRHQHMINDLMTSVFKQFRENALCAIS